MNEKNFKSRLHEEFEKEFGCQDKSCNDTEECWENPSIGRSEVVKFYDTQVQKLLEEIVPKEMVNTKEESTSDWFYGYGYNQAIAETKNKIKEAGY